MRTQLHMQQVYMIRTEIQCILDEIQCIQIKL
jgi:hypothetical protein